MAVRSEFSKRAASHPRSRLACLSVSTRMDLSCHARPSSPIVGIAFVIAASPEPEQFRPATHQRRLRCTGSGSPEPPPGLSARVPIRIISVLEYVRDVKAYTER